MRARIGVCWLLLAATGLAPVRADELALVATEENDVFANPWGAHSDRHFTQGLKFSLLAGEAQFTKTTTFLDRLLPTFRQPDRQHLGFVLLAQHIYTPGAITNPLPILDDRPYAGWLYSGLIFQRAGQTAAGLPQFENWELDLGIVGPPSLAALAQTEVHRAHFPNDVPLGWDNQLPFEPGLELKYDRRWRLSLLADDVRWLDLIPHIGASLGNIRVHANAGLLARLGWNLPDDYGPAFLESTLSPTAPRPKRLPLGVYLFAGVEGRAIAHDLFLDGSTFRDSLKVDRRPFVGELQLGVGLVVLQHVELTYTYLRRTDQFAGQQGPDVLASLNARINFYF